MAAKATNGSAVIVKKTGDNVVISGGNGADVINADALFSTVAAGTFYQIVGGNGADVVNGSSRDETIWGDSSGSSSTSDNGADTLNGGGGNDQIHGGNGADAIAGDAGADRLWGDRGPDRFIYKNVGDSNGVDGIDIVEDFTSLSDKLDLTLVPLTGVDAPPELQWLGNVNTGDEYGVWWYYEGGFTKVFADTDGDGVADLEIHLRGNINLVYGDFLGINIAPVLADPADGSVAEVDQSSATVDSGLSGTLSATDLDPDTLTYGLVGGVDNGDGTVSVAGTYGTLTVTTATGAYSYAKNNGAIEALDDGDSPSDSFIFTVADGQGGSASQGWTVSVTGADDAPTLAGVADGSVSEDDQASTLSSSGLSGTLDGDDVDGDALAYGIDGGTDNLDGTVSLAGTYGTLTLDTTTGAYEYVPNAAAFEGLDSGFADTDVFTFTVSDGDGAAVTTSYTVNIAGADDAPTLAAVLGGSVSEVDQSSATVDVGLSGNLDGDDVDDGEVLTYGIVGGVLNGDGTMSLAGVYGTLTVDTATGAYSYAKNTAAIEALAAGDSDTDDFTVTVSDGDGDPVGQTYTVTVNGADETPPYTPPPVYSGGADPNDFDTPPALPLPNNNNVSLGNGDDVFVGGPAGQNIDGNNGGDTIYGNGGNDTINGNGHADKLYGNTGNDKISGNNDDDKLYGGSGTDELIGGNGNDTLYGGSDNDTIDGQNGNDLIIGGYGADTLTGGGDNDTFLYLSALDTGDTITDFTQGFDKINLAAFAPSSFVGALGSPGAVGANEVGYVTSGGTTTIYVDTDGVLGADLEIHLTGTIALTAADFIFV